LHSALFLDHSVTQSSHRADSWSHIPEYETTGFPHCGFLVCVFWMMCIMV